MIAECLLDNSNSLSLALNKRSICIETWLSEKKEKILNDKFWMQQVKCV